MDTSLKGRRQPHHTYLRKKHWQRKHQSFVHTALTVSMPVIRSIKFKYNILFRITTIDIYPGSSNKRYRQNIENINSTRQDPALVTVEMLQSHRECTGLHCLNTLFTPLSSGCLTVRTKEGHSLQTSAYTLLYRHEDAASDIDVQ